MTTRVTVMADTHMPRPGRSLPDALVKSARESDLIVHLGDFTGIEVADFLGSLGPFAGVHGNNDTDAIRERFPLCSHLEIGGWRLTLLHGHTGGRTAFLAAQSVSEADIVLYGHSHIPRVVWRDNRLLLNPGSPTERRWVPHKSFAVLTLGREVNASLVVVR